jgi:hypothetical protein
MALQITLGLEPSIHAGWRAVRARNGLKVDKLGLAERFDLLVFHRGLHCSLCAKYRIELERLMPGFASRGVNVLAIRSDTKELGQEMARKGTINININININTSGVRSAPSLSLKSAREWGLFTSAPRGKTSIGIEEPALFSEPAVDLLRPDSTL